MARRLWPNMLLALLSLSLPAFCASEQFDLPQHKRGYTLYTPDRLEADVKCPAVIWLHPSGGTFKGRILSDYWTDLNRLKVFLVIPDSAQPKWDDPDEQYLLDLVQDLPHRGAVDSNRLVLFGCESGGQMAFQMVRHHPTRFASIVTMSAWPVTGAAEPALDLPPDSAAERLSFLFCIGTADGGRQFVRRATEILTLKGFAVGLKEVPGAGPTYLAPAKPAILDWLAQIAAGKRPVLNPDPKEIELRNARDNAARRMLDSILHPAPPTPSPPDTPIAEQAPVIMLSFPKARVSLNVPPGWKSLSDSPAAALLTTVVPPEDPLLIQVSRETDPAGLEHAVKDRRLRLGTDGINYRFVTDADLTLDGQSWKLEQSTCVAYHRVTTETGQARVVDRPAYLTAAWRPLGPTEFLRVVFLHTDSLTDPGPLVRQTLPSVKPMQLTNAKPPSAD